MQQFTDWDSFLNFLCDASWGEIFDLPIENCASEIASWMKAFIDAFVPSRKYQIKL